MKKTCMIAGFSLLILLIPIYAVSSEYLQVSIKL